MWSHSLTHTHHYHQHTCHHAAGGWPAVPGHAHSRWRVAVRPHRHKGAPTGMGAAASDLGCQWCPMTIAKQCMVYGSSNSVPDINQQHTPPPALTLYCDTHPPPHHPCCCCCCCCPPHQLPLHPCSCIMQCGLCNTWQGSVAGQQQHHHQQH